MVLCYCQNVAGGRDSVISYASIKMLAARKDYGRDAMLKTSSTGKCIVRAGQAPAIMQVVRGRKEAEDARMQIESNYAVAHGSLPQLHRILKQTEVIDGLRSYEKSLVDADDFPVCFILKQTSNSDWEANLHPLMRLRGEVIALDVVIRATN